MDIMSAYRKACDCEPSEQDFLNINKITEQDYSDVGEAITIAYLCGKIIGKGEAYGE